MDNGITWIQLSDLHITHMPAAAENHRLERLHTDIIEAAQKLASPPDLLFVVGDIVRGCKASETGEAMREQYANAFVFIEGLLDELPSIRPERVFTVPGNHDVCASAIDPAHTQQLDRLLREPSGAASVAAMIGRVDVTWRGVIKRLAEYREFVRASGYNRATSEYPDQLMYAQVVEICGVSLGIAGLNTAWSCTPATEKSHLWTALPWQLEQLQDVLRPATIRVALMHHPTSWLNSQEGTEAARLLSDQYSFLLTGHEHDDWVTAQLPGHVGVATGASQTTSHRETG